MDATYLIPKETERQRGQDGEKGGRGNLHYKRENRSMIINGAIMRNRSGDEQPQTENKSGHVAVLSRNSGQGVLPQKVQSRGQGFNPGSEQ